MVKEFKYARVEDLDVKDGTRAIFRTEARAEGFARRFGKGFDVEIQPLSTSAGLAFEVVVTHAPVPADGPAKDE